MNSKSMEEHRKQSSSDIKIGVITLSDSKYKDNLQSKQTDVSGKIIINAVENKYELVSYIIIPDDSKLLLSHVIDIIENQNADVIITTGGTGIGSRDITIETFKAIFDKELTGFGEIFRYETYKELRTGALLSRATAGVYKKTLIVSIPGSPNAVKLGLKIILPELSHLVKHLKE